MSLSGQFEEGEREEDVGVARVEGRIIYKLSTSVKAGDVSRGRGRGRGDMGVRGRG